MHIHAAPDVRARKLNDIELARSAKEAGMAAIVLKSHVTLTADRAKIAQYIVPGIHVFGSLTLNLAVGGINPVAVNVAIRMGAKIIWLPTISSNNHREFHGDKGGITLLNSNGDVIPEIIEICRLIKGTNTILATGHISLDEIQKIVPIAKNEGVQNIVITHPEVPWINMPVDMQADLLKYNVFFERCFVSTLDIGGGVPFERIVGPIQQLGVDSTLLSTDFGAAQLPHPIEGYLAFIEALRQAGFSEEQIIQMGVINPSKLLEI
jgi:hypothetical protein